jgi:protein-tyrosine phosphatase
VVPALIPGTFNSRDIGGIAAGGQVVRRGRVIRSDAPVALGESGRCALRDLGMRRAIDLREAVERRLDPPELDGIEVHHAPVLGDGFRVDESTTLEDVYRGILEQRGAALAGVVRLLALDGGPTLIFCSAGKDRTGIVVAVVLAALGVSAEEIVDDYARTEDNMHGPFRAAIEARAAAAGLTKQELAVKLGAPRRLMRDTLGWLERQHGGAGGYLRSHGVSDAELAEMRRVLTVPR